MDRPTLEDLKARFEEMKAEQDYIRMQFFKNLFEKLYPEKDHNIHRILIEAGPPDYVALHPITAEKIMESVSILEYCEVIKDKYLEDNRIVFMWYPNNLISLNTFGGAAIYSNFNQN